MYSKRDGERQGRGVYLINQEFQCPTILLKQQQCSFFFSSSYFISLLHRRAAGEPIAIHLDACQTWSDETTASFQKKPVKN
jgi:hypothetical protein